jgi:hypothetical protein
MIWRVVGGKGRGKRVYSLAHKIFVKQIGFGKEFSVKKSIKLVTKD